MTAGGRKPVSRRRDPTWLAGLVALVASGGFGVWRLLVWCVDNRWWDFRVDLGNLAGYVGAVATLIAVMVAFIFNRRAVKTAQAALTESQQSTELSRQSLAVSERSAELSQRSIEDAEARARLDRVYAHRRETVKAVTDMWAAMRPFRSEVDRYKRQRVAAQNTDTSTIPTDAAKSLVGTARRRVVETRSEVISAANYAAVLADSGEVSDHVNKVQGLVMSLRTELEQNMSYAVVATGAVEKWGASIDKHLKIFEKFDDEHVELLRRVLPLHDQAEATLLDQREREARRRALKRAMDESPEDIDKMNELYKVFHPQERARDHLTGEPPAGTATT